MDKLEDHDIEYIAMSVLALIDKGKITGQLAKDLAKLCAVAYQNNAGVAYQGEWTVFEDGEPLTPGEYTITYTNWTEHVVFDLHWLGSEWNIEPMDGWEIVAWREKFTPYQTSRTAGRVSKL